MPDTLTANYDFLKPEINGSPNTWGNKLNSNFDLIDAALFAVQQVADDSVLRAGSGTDPDDYIREVLRYKDTVTPANDRDLINVALVKTWVANSSPVGQVTKWGGTVASIPTCWALCDGSTVNGVLTPNLRNKFVIGAGDTYAPGAFGGATTHDHGGNTGNHTLTLAQIPSHTHSYSDPGHFHSVSDPGHVHIYYAGVAQFGSGGPVGDYSGAPNGKTSDGNVTGIGVVANVTGITINANGGGGAHLHTIAAANHLPPFYALAYIMRVKYPWE